ncbi:MAG: hypothetical protein RL662_2049 [Bacteroidota bacterium]|jgi:hypothetical protein
MLALFSVVCLVGFTACEKEIHVDLHSVEPRLVIEGLIVKDSLAKVTLTKTKDFDSDNIFQPITDAVVTISDDKGNYEVLKADQSGVFRSVAFIGKVNTKYNLKVVYAGNEYTSTSTMPQLVVIDTIKLYDIPSFGYPVPLIEFQDPIDGTAHYYKSTLHINGVRRDIGGETTDTRNREGLLIQRILPVFDKDESTKPRLQKGDTILVELQAIDKGVHDFFESLAQISSSETNPTTNIMGGALGYFSANTSHRKSMIADW